jgi:two-component system chemotaxis response regulator CheY
MHTLIVEDDLTSRILLQAFLSQYGECHAAVNGIEAVEAFGAAVERQRPYDLICMDIMMPEMSGQTALEMIREQEEKSGTPWKNHVRIVMTTALGDIKQVMASFRGLCDAYVTKPIDTSALREHLRTMGLVA